MQLNCVFNLVCANTNISEVISIKMLGAALIVFIPSYLAEYILNIFIASHFSPSLYGDFSLAIQFMIMTAPFYIFGINLILTKFLSQYLSTENYPAISKLLHWGIARVLRSFCFVLIFISLAVGLTVWLTSFNHDFLQHYHMAVYFQFISS